MSRFEIDDSDLPKALTLLSVERMAVFKSITGDERDAILLHHQMLDVAAALMPVTAMLEICLRNAVSERLRSLFGTADWLQTPPPPFQWRGEEKNAIRKAERHARRAEYTKKNQYEKRLLDKMAFPEGFPPNLSHEQRVRERQKRIEITLGQLIAQLTLSFWKRLFSSDYHSSLWDRSLKRIFPDKSIDRADIAENLEMIYQSRNRIAHHEPLYGVRLVATLKAIDVIAGAFGDKINSTHTLVEVMIEHHRTILQQEATKLDDMISKYTIGI